MFFLKITRFNNLLVYFSVLPLINCRNRVCSELQCVDAMLTTNVSCQLLLLHSLTRLKQYTVETWTC